MSKLFIEKSGGIPESRDDCNAISMMVAQRRLRSSTAKTDNPGRSIGSRWSPIGIAILKSDPTETQDYVCFKLAHSC